MADEKKTVGGIINYPGAKKTSDEKDESIGEVLKRRWANLTGGAGPEKSSANPRSSASPSAPAQEY